jgi:hypothetical protein
MNMIQNKADVKKYVKFTNQKPIREQINEWKRVL